MLRELRMWDVGRKNALASRKYITTKVLNPVESTVSKQRKQSVSSQSVWPLDWRVPGAPGYKATLYEAPGKEARRSKALNISNSGDISPPGVNLKIWCKSEDISPPGVNLKIWCKSEDISHTGWKYEDMV